MTGMTTLTRQNLLQYVTAKASMPALATPGSVWLALFTAVGTDAGTGFTEVSTGSYARVLTQAANINAAGSTIPCTISNSGNLSFPASTGSWGNIIAWGIYDASTTGNLLYWDFLGNDPWVPCSITLASPGVITAIGITAGSAPTLANGAIVVFGEHVWRKPFRSRSCNTLSRLLAGLSDTFNVSVNTASTGNGNGSGRSQCRVSLPG